MFDCPRCGADRRKIAPVHPCTKCGHVLVDPAEAAGTPVDGAGDGDFGETGLSAMPPPPTKEDSDRMRESIMRFRTDGTTVGLEKSVRPTIRGISTIDHEISRQETHESEAHKKKRESERPRRTSTAVPPPFDPTSTDGVAAPPSPEHTPPVELLRVKSDVEEPKTEVEIVHEMTDHVEEISEADVETPPMETRSPQSHWEAQVASEKNIRTATTEPVLTSTDTKEPESEIKMDAGRVSAPTKPPPRATSASPSLPLSARLALDGESRPEPDQGKSIKSSPEPAPPKIEVNQAVDSNSSSEAEKAIDALWEERAPTPFQLQAGKADAGAKVESLAKEGKTRKEDKLEVPLDAKWKTPHSSAQKWADRRRFSLGGQIRRKPQPLGVMMGVLLAGLSGWVLMQVLPGHAPNMASPTNWVMQEIHYRGAQVAGGVVILVGLLISFRAALFRPRKRVVCGTCRAEVVAELEQFALKCSNGNHIARIRYSPLVLLFVGVAAASVMGALLIFSSLTGTTP